MNLVSWARYRPVIIEKNYPYIHINTEFDTCFYLLSTAMRIHLSPDTAASLQRYSGYHLTCRGEIAVKGKGIMKTFFLDGKDNFIPELPSSPNNTVDSTSLNEGPGANCGLLNESHVIATRTNSDHSKVVKLCANGDQPNKAPSACQCSADSFLCKSNLNLDFLPQETHL